LGAETRRFIGKEGRHPISACTRHASQHTDQPLLAANDPTELNAAFKKRPSGNVLVPIVAGQRGNPVLLDAQAQERILAGDALGCRQFIDRHPELVHRHETANARFVTDLDTQRTTCSAWPRDGTTASTRR
jgi:molybdenum cofactor cytidylyltransferase